MGMMLRINIPKRGQKVTNGDVIKALFPNGIVLMTNSLGVGYKLNDSKKEGYMPWFDKDWWNAPYKVGDTDGNSGNDT